jgi:single-strand DNA-binding protein
MAGVNKAILLGNVGKDPEIKAFEGGRKVANFTLATTESYKDKNGEKVDNTEWHNIAFWGPVVDVIEKYVKKGSQLYIEGKIRTRSYEAKEGGKKYITEIQGDTLTLLGAPRQSEGGNSKYAGNSSTDTNVSEPFAKSSSVDTDDLPF